MSAEEGFMKVPCFAQMKIVQKLFKKRMDFIKENFTTKIPLRV